MTNPKHFDFDYLVIGSGFGGSVSALRLAQKGYKVGLLEAGRRIEDSEFAKTNWDLKKFLWAPFFGCLGIQRFYWLKKVLVMCGSGLGGGSLVYANTLYRPKDSFLQSPACAEMEDWETWQRYFDLASKMLGVSKNRFDGWVEQSFRQLASDLGHPESFCMTPVGVYSEKAEVLSEKEAFQRTSKDPYFQGEGPLRQPCIYCGACMVGCRHNAKNTLRKNYLFFAETLGVKIFTLAHVDRIEPLNEKDPVYGGYKVLFSDPRWWKTGSKNVLSSQNIIFSAGALGSQRLLQKMLASQKFGKFPKSLGHSVRTNSESIIGVSFPKGNNLSKGLAITCSIHLDENTHIEPVRYNKGSDAMALLASPHLVDGGGPLPRFLKFMLLLIINPLKTLRLSLPMGFADKSVIFLAMQTIDSTITVHFKRRWLWPFKKILVAEQGERPIPTYIPQANQAARIYAQRNDGLVRSSINEALLDVPITAHILGGCLIGKNVANSVVDPFHKIHGHPHLIVCDGSIIGGNLGVNPSLTITAFSERAMSYVPLAPDQKELKLFGFEKNWKVSDLLNRT